jgi:hypothetical protein
VLTRIPKAKTRRITSGSKCLINLEDLVAGAGFEHCLARYRAT